jgi:hypothetical protein
MTSYRPNWGLDDADTGELPTLDATNGAEPPAEADPEDGYSDVYTWVTQWALPTLGSAAQTGGRRWCTQWQDHPEAMLRLTLAWKTWERARHDPTAYTNWLLDTWDRMWAALTAPDGPFAACTAHRHDQPPELPVMFSANSTGDSGGK